MSHEIRTPMAGVMGMADMLLKDDLPKDSEDKVYKIKDATQSLLQIINEVLDISKMEAGKFAIENLDFHVPSLIKDVMGLFEEKRKADGKHDLALNLNLDDSFPTSMNADPTRLRQVLINLLGNAMKFTLQGAVTLKGDMIKAEDGRDFVRIAVEDTGIGIGTAAQNGLFADFAQADASISRKFEGTGLGLSICKRLIEIMGGDIGVDSQEGAGSTFWFTIPYKESLSPVQETESLYKRPETQYKATRPLNILVAEDNRLNQQIIGAYLQGFGHQFLFADNGATALQAFAEGEFDLILMDVRMPEMSGIDATRGIRKMETGATRTPIIALTADVMDENRQECLKVGMDDLVAKPIKVSSLARTIDRALGETLHHPVQLAKKTVKKPRNQKKKDDMKPERTDDPDIADLMQKFQNAMEK